MREETFVYSVCSICGGSYPKDKNGVIKKCGACRFLGLSYKLDTSFVLTSVERGHCFTKNGFLKQLLSVKTGSEREFLCYDDSILYSVWSEHIDFTEKVEATVEEEILLEDLRERIDTTLDSLNERERAVVSFRFGLFDYPVLTLQEIGDELDVGRERVRQIESSAIKKLKHPRVSRNLKNYAFEGDGVFGVNTNMPTKFNPLASQIREEEERHLKILHDLNISRLKPNTPPKEEGGNTGASEEEIREFFSVSTLSRVMYMLGVDI